MRANGNLATFGFKIKSVDE
jgi:hypothetical protein